MHRDYRTKFYYWNNAYDTGEQLITGVADTGDYIHSRISPRIFEKIWNGPNKLPNGIRARGTLISEKTWTKSRVRLLLKFVYLFIFSVGTLAWPGESGAHSWQTGSPSSGAPRPTLAPSRPASVTPESTPCTLKSHPHPCTPQTIDVIDKRVRLWLPNQCSSFWLTSVACDCAP